MSGLVFVVQRLLARCRVVFYSMWRNPSRNHEWNK